MKLIIMSLISVSLLSGAANATGESRTLGAHCTRPDPALREAAHLVLTEAKTPTIAAWARYLNAQFYDDLACRLAPDMTPEDILRLRDNPAQLIARIRAGDMVRNQSDALILILSAMQSTEE